jgi:acyl transferase domain-containing protein
VILTGQDGGLDRRIAIVGMAGRFPGAGNVAEFWGNLCDGVESVSRFTEEELLASGVDPEQIKDPAYVPARPVLDEISGFDAAFFGMSPRMASLTDPQQRLFLEVCWEALEQAGYAASEYRGRVGVYGGANISTYLLRRPEQMLGDAEISTYEIIMGNDKDALTTTASYLFDLSGPSVAVQTFCSTSLVATHLAVRSLRSGECELALAGGVSIRVPDRVGHRYGPGGMESPDGHVRTFDAAARGCLFGDGAAVVVLKRLADAVRDGDNVWAVIRGSALNNDGALKVGYTAPSVVGQARVISDALVDAGVTGEDISYLEAHGTATELGDPIELAALTRAFGETTEHQYCPIGSVKTNIGHLDRAAGATGLIKTALALRTQLIPPSLHYTSPNPQIDFAHSPFYVNTSLTPWRTRDGRPPIAGLNSLGMGGTNVHVVLEQAPVRAVRDPDGDSGRRYQVLALSARSATAAEQACGRLAGHLAGELAAGVPPRLVDVAYTLQVGRRTFEHRRALVAGTIADAVAGFGGQPGGAGTLSRVDAVRGRRVAFLFTGVGEQYPGLVHQLYQREPVFRSVLDGCTELLRGSLPDVDLIDLVAGARGQVAGLAALLGRGGTDGTEAVDPRAATLGRTEVVQPALFAVEYALARTFMAWGVQPSLMFGYSLGEYVAACLAGVLSLPDAIALVAYRAKLIATVDAGAMAVVPLTVDELAGRFRLAERCLDIAAVNGERAVVVAGPVEPMERFVADVRSAEIPCRPLQTTHAFHSGMLAAIGDELTGWVRDNIRLNPPVLPYISNVTGELADPALVCAPGYWASHMCRTVRFTAGAQVLLADPELAVLEIGPGQSLGAMLRGTGCPPPRWPLILSALPAGADSRPDDAVLADCLARMWLLGVRLDWAAYHGRPALPGAVDPADLPDPALPGRVPLPTYPFQRQRYWIEPLARAAGTGAAGAALAGPARPGPASFEAISDLPKLPEELWLHLPVWRQTAWPAAAASQPGQWLVFTMDGVADDVVARLGAVLAPAGCPPHLVRPGAGYAQTADGHTVRPGNFDDLRSLLRDLRSAGRPVERVVHLWALGTASPTDGLYTLVALARAAGELGLEGWSLDVAVAGTQQVLGGDVTDPHAALLTGACRVIPLEYPTVTTRLIDVEPDTGGGVRPGMVDALVAEVCRPQTEPTVALRRGRRWVPGYETMAAPEPVPTGIVRDGGVYLITGGLGGIGLGLAGQLAEECRAKLVLFGRTGLPEPDRWPSILAGAVGDQGVGEQGVGEQGVDEATRSRIAAVAALLDLGAEVEIVVGDVSNPADVSRAVAAAVRRFGALHGVLHAAGVPGMGLMQFKNPEELGQVLAPKVAGTLAIAEALRIGAPDEIELDFLVLFSSITSATGGGPGQVDYCAANAFLDSCAYQLAATGRRVLSVNWSEWTWNGWEEGLTGYAESLREFFRANRARIGIDAADGWRSLLRALGSGEPRVVVCTQDFPTLVGFSSYFTVDAVTSSGAASEDATRHPRPELVTAYLEPTGRVEETIATVWRDALRLDLVGAQDNFFELGGNSLLGMSIVAALRREFALTELPPHILYEAPTVEALGKIVEVGLLPAGGTGGPRAGAAGSSAGDDQEGDQARARLRRSGIEAAARRRGRQPRRPDHQA